MTTPQKKPSIGVVFSVAAMASAVLIGVGAVGFMIAGRDRHQSKAAEDDAQTEEAWEESGEIIHRKLPAGIAEFSVLPLGSAPCGIWMEESGIALVTDAHNKTVWEINGGDVHVLSGADSVTDRYEVPVGGYYDAVVEESLFREPFAIVPFMDGYAVSDPGNKVIRLVHDGRTETLGGSASTMPDVIEQPMGLATDSAGNLYYADAKSGTITRVTTDGTAERVLEGLSGPTGLCMADDILYIAESNANRIIKWQNGVQEVVAGSGEAGNRDGAATEAMFASPQGIAVDADGAIYVADTVNGAIRRIADGEVTTTLFGQQFSELESWPVSPIGLALSGGKLYVCDRFSRRVYVLTLSELEV